MSTPSESNEPSDYSPRRLRGLAALGLGDGSKPVPARTRFHSSLEQSADSLEAHLAALKNSLTNKDIPPVTPGPVRPGPTERRQARGGWGNVTESLRKAAIFACVAAIGATLAVGAQLGYERWKKSERAAKADSVLLRSIPINSSPDKLSGDSPRATNGQSQSYATAVKDRVVPAEPAPENSAQNDASQNVIQREAKAASPEGDKAGDPSPAAPLARSVSPEDAAFLFARGQEFLRVGDLASARALFERAAEGGNGPAAYALAATYDPGVLRRFGFGVVSADPALARVWYEKAAKLGVRAIPDPVR